MAISKAKKYKVIPNQDLIRAGRSFVPSFGNDDDLRIVNRIVNLEKMYPSVDNELMRSGDRKKMTTKMVRILDEESYLISAITMRNNDF